MATKRIGCQPFNPNLVGYNKCYHCLKFYDASKDHYCYKINRIKDWRYRYRDARVHTPSQDEPANLGPIIKDYVKQRRYKMNYNKVIFGGRMTADVVVKTIGNGNLAVFNIASNSRKRKQDGTFIEEACFLEVEAWGTKADIASKFLKKGGPVMIEGHLKQSNWEDKNGNKRSKISLICDDIILIDKTNDTPVQNSKTVVNPNISKKVSTIKDAGFEISSIDVQPDNKEQSEDLPF